MSATQLLLSSVHQAGLHCNNIFGITLTLTHTIMQVQVKMPVDFFQEPFGGTKKCYRAHSTSKAWISFALLLLLHSCWVDLSLESQLCDGVEEVHHIEAQLQEMPAFANMPRQCIGWALLIFFTSKVCMSVSHICIVVCCTVENKFTSTHVQLN